MSRFRMSCCVAMALSLAATSALAGASLTRIADGATLTPNTGQPLLLSSLYPVVDDGSVYFVSGDASLPTGSIFRHDPVGGLGTFADAANIGAANIASFSVDEGTAAYYADGNAIFTWDGATKTTIADRNTPYPLSTLSGAFATPPVGSFTSLGVPHIENDTVAFRGGYWGFGSGGNPNYLHEGIYTYDLNAGGPIEVVADIGTTAPGQANTFSYFAQQQNAFGFSTALGADEGGPVLDEAGNLLFVGFAPGSGSGRLITRDDATGTLNQPAFYGSGRRELDLDDGVVTQASGGVFQYELDGTPLPGIATRNQVIPGTSATLNWTLFSASADGDRVLFVGIEPSGRSAIYLSENGVSTELVSTDDVLDNGQPRIISGFSSAFRIGRESLEGDTFAFTVSLEDLTTGAVETVLYRGDLGASTLPGDYSGDGFVSQADLDLVLLNWGDTTLPAGLDESALDGGFDGLISQNELDGVLLNWGDGTPPPPANAIPEPATAALMLVSLLPVRRRRGGKDDRP